MFLQNLLLMIMLISHIRNRCIQSGRRDRATSVLQCRTQRYNSGWLDPNPVICFLSSGLSLYKMQKTLNFFMNFRGQSKPVSHPCEPNFCYCCSIHELDVLDPTSLSFWNSSSYKLCFPRLWSVFHIPGRNKWHKTPGAEWLCIDLFNNSWVLGCGWEKWSYRKRTEVAVAWWGCWHAWGREWGKKNSSKPSNPAFYFS